MLFTLVLHIIPNIPKRGTHSPIKPNSVDKTNYARLCWNLRHPALITGVEGPARVVLLVEVDGLVNTLKFRSQGNKINFHCLPLL